MAGFRVARGVGVLTVAVLGMCVSFASRAVAAACPTAADAIDTDRPDVTNSSRVVPLGSLQVESGVNLSGRGSGVTLDGTNARLRLGIAACAEVLLDAPNGTRAVRGGGSSGVSDVAPAVKYQLRGLPAGITVSTVAGLGVPTGTRPFGGHGYAPYLQVPWEAGAANGWRLAGMATAFFHPAESQRNPTFEPTVVIGREVDERLDVFVEYVGDYPAAGRASHLLNSGAAFRLTRAQQIDMHVAAGLNDTAPTYILGIGYSIRLDGLF